VYVRDAQGALAFHALGEPSADDVAQVAAWTHAAIVRVLERHGRSLEGVSDTEDEIAHEQPVLASLYGASTTDVQLLGAAPGQKTSKLVRPVHLVPTLPQLVAEVGGVNVHATAALDGRDRPRLERLCRYVARPPLAQDRLEMHGDGGVRYRFKAAWKDGTHAVLLDPLDFIARLCALIPSPRFHTVRYHGVLAAHSSGRREVVPGRRPKKQLELPLFQAAHAPLEPPPASRHPWDWLLKRVFAADLSVCPVAGCDGRMRIVDVVTQPDEIARALGAPPRAARAPPRPRSAPQGQLRLMFG
jgi:hypothetical protein